MEPFVVPPSPNFGVRVTLAVNSAGNTCAYCSRSDIVIMRHADKQSVYDFDNRTIPKAHKVLTAGIKFIRYKQEDGKQCEYLCSCGDDGYINIWDVESLMIVSKCSLQSITSEKLVGIDVLCNNEDVVSVTEHGLIVKYNLRVQKAVIYEVDVKQLNAVCIAASPHKEDLIAIGGRKGLIVVYSSKGYGKLIHKLRPHENDVLSISWCPVPYNVFHLENHIACQDFDVENFKNTDNSLLLASCSRDNTIYICKAGTNGNCETFFNLPSKPLTYVPNYGLLISTLKDRIHCVSWVKPTTLVVSTCFGELLSVRLRHTEQSAKADKSANDVSADQWNFKLLHKQHKRHITTVAVPYERSEDNFPIWTLSADRTICRYSTESKEIVFIPTLTGFIYGLAFSTSNPDLLAMASSDSKIYLWNIADEDCLDIKVLSKKIKDKVMTVSFNPLSEGSLAFGTSEGRVGVCDISQGYSNTKLMKLYHSKPIYRLCWIPFSYDLKEQNKEEPCRMLYKYRLLAVGGGIILQYNPWKEDTSPVALKDAFTKVGDGMYVTELSYHSPDSVVAVGFKDGNVCICDSRSLKQVKSVFKAQNKTIQSMMWHPQFTSNAINEVSPYKDWLAIAAENVVVYKIDTSGDQPPQKVAYHDIHKEKVNEICWSPHCNGRLLSVSRDHCAVVWDAISHTVLGYYINHASDVLHAGLWHPVITDLVITAGQDTCHVWSLISDVVGSLGAKDQKRKQKQKHECDLLVVPEPAHVLRKSAAASGHEKKPEKGRSKLHLLPNFGTQFEKMPYLEDAINEKLPELCAKETTPIVDGHNDVSKEQTNGVKDSDEINPEGPRMSYFNVFRNEDAVEALIRHEEKALDSIESSSSLVLSQSLGELKEKITEAMKKNQVTESMVMLAPSISQEFWKEACAVYIEQMIHQENMIPAVNVLLAMNQKQQVVDLLCERNYFKEAFLIARACLKEQAEDVARKWVLHCVRNGNYRIAAQCYLYLDDYVNAANILMRSNHTEDKYLAAKLLRSFDENKGTAFAAECFRHFIADSAWSEIQNLLHLYPSLKHLSPWYDIAHHLHAKEIKPDMVIAWLEGRGIETESLEEQKVLHYDGITEEDYDKLLPVIPTDSFNMDIGQLVTRISGQMALAVASEKKEDGDETRLKHLVKAVDYAYSYRILNANSEHNEFTPLLNVLMMLFPGGPTITNMLIDHPHAEKNVVMLQKSLRAFLGECATLWLVSLKVNDREETSEDSSTPSMTENKGDVFNAHSKINNLIVLLSIFLKDILNTDTALYYKDKTKLKTLETRGLIAFCTYNDILQGSEEGNEIPVDTHSMKEQIKNFEQQRVSSPDPFYFVSVLKTFLTETKTKAPFQDDTDIVVLLELLLKTESECDM